MKYEILEIKLNERTYYTIVKKDERGNIKSYLKFVDPVSNELYWYREPRWLYQKNDLDYVEYVFKTFIQGKKNGPQKI